MKISEITLDTVRDYINAFEETDKNIQMLLDASKHFILKRTGIAEDKLDNYEDLSIVALCVCSDMYDRRQFTNDTSSGTTVNPIVDSILNMHSFNLV
ncbi:head-tail connector protein [Romboutsia timonensis]|uniref:head-tail connector protein n=1 Tax=Romboutsia timonensis TaxID=1776391 RepID=UPI002A8222ED|nr:head-tail connector protein [Romboutsia timonensis]MDY3960173.1 head-tail connector protein [Romboutsia timonensis]